MSAFDPLQTLERCRTLSRMRAVIFAILSLAGCGRPPDAPQWKAAYRAAQWKALTGRDAFLQRCFGGHFADKHYVGDFKCMPYSPPQRLRGVWVIVLEYSGFFPNASS